MYSHARMYTRNYWIGGTLATNKFNPRKTTKITWKAINKLTQSISTLNVFGVNRIHPYIRVLCTLFEVMTSKTCSTAVFCRSVTFSRSNKVTCTCTCTPVRESAGRLATHWKTVHCTQNLYSRTVYTYRSTIRTSTVSEHLLCLYRMYRNLLSKRRL